MLPYEVEDSLPTSTAKLLWPVKFLKEALGLQNETQCREWFAQHPEVLKACLDCHRELEAKIADIQTKAREGLELIVAREKIAKYDNTLKPRQAVTAFDDSLPVARSTKRSLDDDVIELGPVIETLTPFLKMLSNKRIKFYFFPFLAASAYEKFGFNPPPLFAAACFNKFEREYEPNPAASKSD